MSQMKDDVAAGGAGAVTAEPVERRKVSRHRTLKGGSIRFNNGAAYDCRVRNLSPAGAMLEVAGQLGIPEEFTLVIEVDHFRQNCRVIWRTTTRLGVAFT
jgi:hypothetical protein